MTAIAAFALARELDLLAGDGALVEDLDFVAAEVGTTVKATASPLTVPSVMGTSPLRPVVVPVSFSPSTLKVEGRLARLAVAARDLRGPLAGDVGGVRHQGGRQHEGAGEREGA